MNKPKKTTLAIVSRTGTGWHINQIIAAAKDAGVEARVVNPTSANPLGPQIQKAGDVILWRASSLDHQSERPSVAPYLDNKIMVNDTLFRYPMAAYKYFQQNMLVGTAITKKYAIETFRAKTRSALTALIKKDELRYPFIAKPNKGAQGVGVELIKSENELARFTGGAVLSDYIFQNFIENDGDWRVIVMGGYPLGALKRIAKAGSHLNNISQGATAEVEVDPKIRSEVYNIALKAASVFQLRFCGVDIIRDKHTGAFYVLEVNTAPQWDGEYGFQSMTGVNVAQSFVAYAEAMNSRKESDDAVSVIEDYYKRNIGYDSAAEFHFASRMWLWTHDDWARKALDAQRASYIGTTPEEIKETLRKLFERGDSEPVSVNENRKYRQPYYKKYPMLASYNALLFKVIFCESIYGLDLRPYVRELVSDQEFLQLFNNLLADHDAIRVLSTHAVNYFYLLKNYFRDKLGLSTAALVDPQEILAISRGYEAAVESGELKATDAIKLRIYLLTHAILGESRFYQKKVLSPDFKPLIIELEAIIRDNYGDITLDNKCEFLVCASLCGYRSQLKNIVKHEAKQSLSWAGNFLVDVHNVHGGKGGHSLRQAEHRNVLYLMMNKKFVGSAAPRKVVKPSTAPSKMVLGRLARIELPDITIGRIIARVDTGATSSSLHCSEVREEGGVLKFKFVDPTNPLWSGEDIEVSEYKKTTVRNSAGDTDRYVVELTVAMDGFSKKVLFTLANRDTMLYPVLLGRNFIHKDFIVDIDRQFQVRSNI